MQTNKLLREYVSRIIQEALVENADSKPNDFEVLYHGSDKELEVLEPRASKVIENEKAVFATPDRWMAIVFIPKWTDSDIELGFVNDAPYIKEMYKNAFDKLKGEGYIHTVKSTGFKIDERLGMQGEEFIRKAKVSVESVEFVDDILGELKKSKVKMIKAGE